MIVSDEKLMAFADGELSAEERAAIEAALAKDEALRIKLAAHRAMRARLSAAFDGALDEPLPARLRAGAAPRESNVVDISSRRSRAWTAREWSAMAASLVVGTLVGIGVMNAREPLMGPSENGLVAQGALALALNTQLAADEAGAVRIGLSFAREGGGYCRTFDLRQASSSGLACRDGGAWRIEMTVATAQDQEVRMAGAPAALLEAVEAIIDGAPLDHAAEREVQARGWRSLRPG